MDRLGAVLKAGVSRLRGRAETDLVFLVDSSASVGAENFHNEIKFVRKVSEESGSTREKGRAIFFSKQVRSCEQNGIGE